MSLPLCISFNDKHETNFRSRKSVKLMHKGKYINNL